MPQSLKAYARINSLPGAVTEEHPGIHKTKTQGGFHVPFHVPERQAIPWKVSQVPTLGHHRLC